MSSFIAIIPAFNESAHIRAVIEAAKASLPVLVVDDGSADQTASIAESSGASVIRQVPNQGKGAALRAGFHRAIELNYDAAVMLDGDGQHDPLEIPQFLTFFNAEHTDLIIGMRQYNQMPLVRRTSNTIGRWMLHWAVGQPIPDNQSGYRLLSRRMMEAILESTEDRFEFEVEMIATCILRGYTLGWVPIRTIYAGEASHIQPARHIFHWFRIIWQTRQRMRQSLLLAAPGK